MLLIKKTIFLLLSICILATSSFAEIRLNGFGIENSYLINGKLKITPGQPLTFKANFLFFKLGDQYNSVKVWLVYREGNTEIELSSPMIRSEIDFSMSGSPNWESTITGTLPADKTFGQVYLKYQCWQGEFLGPRSYSETGYSTIGGPVPPTISVEGEVIRTTADSKVYHIVNGLARHIQDGGTLAAVFTEITQIRASLTSVGVSQGNPITAGAELLGDRNDGKIYFMENTPQGKVLRYITSPAVAAKYHFKIPNARSITGTAGYIIGQPFQ